jgi:NADH-quinone oxidoreductase subunit K
MIVPYSHILLLSGLLFLMGMFCLVSRRNLIMMVLGLEVMLNAAAVAFIGASVRWWHMDGQAMALFIIAVAAAEVSVGLGLIVWIYRRSGTVSPSCIEADTCRIDF